jgi:rod shape determining protein RodA
VRNPTPRSPSGLTPSNPNRRQGVLATIHLDLPLLTGLLLLCGYGLIILYSASGENSAVVTAQAKSLLIALVVMIGVAQVPPTTLQRWSPWFYAAGVALLATVLLFGDESKGAQRWLVIDLGVRSFRFQPSELMKTGIAMMAAWYLADRRLPPSGMQLLVALVIVIVPVALIVLEPDLGTSILVASAGLFVVFLAGLSWRLILGLGGLGAAGLAVVGLFPSLLDYVLRDYQKQRVLTFLNPETDPLGAGYHIIQSKIAIGSGGIYGKGWLNGTQSQLDFLPERHTDFIFAVLTEEFGLAGALVLLALYLFVMLRGLFIATHAQGNFSRLLAGAIVLVFFVYLFVNTGMVTGLLPVVGVPLPLVSYGGTSLVTLLAGFGILMSIHTHRKLLPT